MQATGPSVIAAISAIGFIKFLFSAFSLLTLISIKDVIAMIDTGAARVAKTR